MKKLLKSLFVIAITLTTINVNASSDSQKEIEMTVVLKNETITEEFKNTLIAKGAQIISEIDKVGVLKIKGEITLVNSLKNDKNISTISPTMELSLPDSNSYPLEEDSVSYTTGHDLYDAYQWDIKQMTNNGESYSINPGSHDTVIGIIDTGIDLTHPDLQSNLLGGLNFAPDALGNIDPNDIQDRNGHGTHVAGSIAANGRVLGIAPNMGIRVYRVFGEYDGTPTDRMVNAIVQAVDDGVDVISLSLGGYNLLGQSFYTDPTTGETIKLGNDVADFKAYKRAIEYAIKNGVVIVAAAGNDALNITNKFEVTKHLNNLYGEQGFKFVGASFMMPASVPGVITVSATGPTNTIASYSNYGIGSIDLTAPGGDVLRYPAPDYFTDMCLSTSLYGRYTFKAGTSMATPKVSATIALMIDQYKKEGRPLNPIKIASSLYQSTTDLGKKGIDEYYGIGLVNTYDALNK